LKGRQRIDVVLSKTNWIEIWSERRQGLGVEMRTMKTLWKSGRETKTVSLALAAAFAVAFLLKPVAGVASDLPEQPPQEVMGTHAENVSSDDGQQTEADDIAELAESDPVDPAERWGIEVTSIRMTANDHMIDFRYRVLDPTKAGELFVRQNKPALIQQETGKVLAVPETAKVGPLRNSNEPQEGKIYWMFFGNAGYLVKAGDKVTVVIGDFRVENLVVE
jgi:hypothetical protein